MGLFDRKKCSICGQELALLGVKKCKDGALCKSCNGKLSPWFRGRKAATIEQIKQQHAYRDANKAKVKSFNVSRSYGLYYRILVDDVMKAFIVTNKDNWRDSNPDVIPLDKLRSCDVTIDENKTEKRKEDGTSFEPKQFKYEYTFTVDIRVNTTYFETMKFEFSQFGKRPTDKTSEEYTKLMDEITKLHDNFKSGEIRMTTSSGSVSLSNDELEDGEWKCECGTVNDSNYCSSCGKPKPDGVRWFCPDCGTENHGKFCTNCGRKRPE